MKSLGYYVSTDKETIIDGQTIPLDTIVRQYGRNIRLGNDSVILTNGCGCYSNSENVTGYYEVSVNVTLTSTSAGTETISLYQDGVPVAGATQSVTVSTAGDVVALSFTAPIRVYCGSTTSVLTIYSSGVTGTLVNSEMTVKKL